MVIDVVFEFMTRKSDSQKRVPHANRFVFMIRKGKNTFQVIWQYKPDNNMAKTIK